MDNADKERRLFHLLNQSPHQTTPEDVREIAKLKQELEKEKPPSQKFDQKIPETAENDAAEIPKITKARPEIKKQRQAAQPVATPVSRRIASGGEWSRLVQYYAECLERENRQQYLIDPELLRSFDCPAEDLRRVIHGGAVLEFETGKDGRSGGTFASSSKINWIGPTASCAWATRF